MGRLAPSFQKAFFLFPFSFLQASSRKTRRQCSRQLCKERFPCAKVACCGRALFDGVVFARSGASGWRRGGTRTVAPHGLFPDRPSSIRNGESQMKRSMYVLAGLCVVSLLSTPGFAQKERAREE